MNPATFWPSLITRFALEAFAGYLLYHAIFGKAHK